MHSFYSSSSDPPYGGLPLSSRLRACGSLSGPHILDGAEGRAAQAVELKHHLHTNAAPRQLRSVLLGPLIARANGRPVVYLLGALDA